MDKKRFYDTYIKCCNGASISESNGEVKFGFKVRDLLNQIPYFTRYPNHLRLLPVKDSIEKGNFVVAYIPAPIATKKTLLLLSHYDVVGVDEFAEAKHLAFDPEAYTKYLKYHIELLDEEAKEDLLNSDYLFGRGTADMKWGVAADIEMLWHFSENPDRQKLNLLMISTPDEEVNSRGMLAAVKELNRLQKIERLEFVQCIVSEPDIASDRKDNVHRLHVGCAGKLLPTVFCVGKETHVGEPFDGLNPNLLVSEMVRKMELNPVFSDTVNGVSTPVPTCLKQSDTKSDYTVQTPISAYAYFNVMTLESTPQEVLTKFKKVAQETFEEVLLANQARHLLAETKSGNHYHTASFEPLVITYSELVSACRKLHGNSFDKAITQLTEHHKNEDVRQLSIRLVARAVEFYPVRQPMMVVFFAPPYYPHSGFVSSSSSCVEGCSKLIDHAYQNEDLYAIDYAYTGLTDMSYLHLPEDVDVRLLKENFPVYGSVYELPLHELSKLNIPFVNIGPLGKDAHKNTERIDVGYSFDKAGYYLADLIEIYGDLYNPSEIK